MGKVWEQWLILFEPQKWIGHDESEKDGNQRGVPQNWVMTLIDSTSIAKLLLEKADSWIKIKIR